MATILVSYDTETAAVGEVLSLFTQSPNFPRYELALDAESCGRFQSPALKSQFGTMMQVMSR